ncbi:MAG: indoleamine 2,3-dioxygenase, partial [Silvanigrellaceae bacterium]|nr:indoleamine 2,3-dioxygenase [Silvanigrellaceae bacterium]
MSEYVAKSQLVLAKGEQTILTYSEGHPSDNFLSSKYGFMLNNTPLLSLPPSHHIWDEFAKAIPLWVNTGTARKEIAKLPLLDASEKSLPAPFLSRASTILTILAHAYYAGDFLFGNKKTTTLPSSLQKPWRIVTQRLQRKHPAYTIYEGIIYNWKYKNPLKELRFAEHMELLVPLTGTPEESISHMVLAEAEIRAAPLVASMTKAQTACIQNNKIELEQSLIFIITTLMEFIDAFMKINLIPGAKTYLHPIIWSITAPVISSQYAKHELGMSGGSLPSVSLIDSFLGRRNYKTEMGKQALAGRKLLPFIQQEFIEAISQFSVADYIEKTKDRNLIDIWDQLHNKYSGERGFFYTHKRKIFNYIQMGMKAGRVSTN